jgi:hypothetical protein
MALRTFEYFPKEATCPLCGKNADSECFLVSVDGKRKGNICEAIPVHTGCLELSWHPDVKIIYQAGKE